MSYDYGWWLLAALNVGLALAFVLGYVRLTRPREWRTFGVLSAFLVALYAEMYGFSLTIYLLTVVRAVGLAPYPRCARGVSNNTSSSCRVRAMA